MKDSDIHPWLILVLQDEPEAFQELYKLTADHVYRISYYLSSNKSEVTDIVNEVYMVLLQSLPSYSFAKPFRPWLNGLIINQVNNWKRKGWRRLRLFYRNNQLSSPLHWKQPDQVAIETEEKEHVLLLVNRLSAKLREVIVLRYYQDCSFEEIALTLGIPLGTAKSRHHEALRKLRLLSEHVMTSKGVFIHVD